MPNSRQVVFEAVLEAAQAKPLPERIQLLDATAEIIGVPALTKELKQQVADLKAAEHRFREFRFRFSQGGRS
jgi:hypothetical protein